MSAKAVSANIANRNVPLSGVRADGGAESDPRMRVYKGVTVIGSLDRLTRFHGVS